MPDYWAMRFKIRLILSLIAPVLVIACMGSSDEACACVKRMPEKEFAALSARAMTGDIVAIDKVWMELDQRDEGTDAWRDRAIKAGAPNATWRMAEAEIEKLPDLSEPAERDKAIGKASELAEIAYNHRSLVEDQRYDGSMTDEYGTFPVPQDRQAEFVAFVREVRGLAEVSRLGLQHWQRLADQGDPIAAHHVAVWYNATKSNYPVAEPYILRAAALGDPTFAGGYAEASDVVRNASKALANQAVLNRAGDAWMQEIMRRKLTKERSAAEVWVQGHQSKPKTKS